MSERTLCRVVPKSRLFLSLVLCLFLGEGAVRLIGHADVDGNLTLRGYRIPPHRFPGTRLAALLDGPGRENYLEHSPELGWRPRWDIDEAMNERFPARIMISAINEPGSLAEIAETVAANAANIPNLTMVNTAPDFTKMVLELEVWDVQHLTQTLRQLRAKPCVSEVVRVNG